MPERINIYEAKAHFSKIVTKVQETGESITICKNGKPVVDVIQHRAVGDPLEPDAELLGAVYRGDPCAPVGEEDWPKELR